MHIDNTQLGARLLLKISSYQFSLCSLSQLGSLLVFEPGIERNGCKRDIKNLNGLWNSKGCLHGTSV